MNPKHKLVIATRSSPLALVQTLIIQKHLQQLYPHLLIDTLPLTTEGDHQLEKPLAAVGGKSLFVKELEHAIQNGRADIAVHSSKDMPVQLPKGLMIATFYQRHDPRDVFVSNHYSNLDTLPAPAIVGTSSLRRQCLIKHLRPDLTVALLRGNVQSRLQKLDAGEFDAIILAAAGLQRLNLLHRIAAYLDPTVFTPAVTQGILCIECRNDDAATLALLKPLHHDDTAACALAERALNQRLQGGCQVPIGAFAELKNNQLSLQGLVGSPDGTQILRASATGLKEHAESLGVQVAEDLLRQGAGSILQQVYQYHG